MDVTGISTVLPSLKIVTERGKNQAGQTVSAERGELVTFTGIKTVTVYALSSIYVFLRVRKKDYFANDTPVEDIDLAHKRGWVILEIFMAD